MREAARQAPLHRGRRVLQAARSGVVMGLAWTSMGGDTLYVEATPASDTGKAGFKQTGQLGNVMVESSEIAYTYVRSFLRTSREAARVLQEALHPPARAGRRHAQGRPVGGHHHGLRAVLAGDRTAASGRLAMTGELTLTGRVMPIGGVKEKMIAARRAKVTNLILPQENRADYEDLDPQIGKGIAPHFVSTFDEARKICFPDGSQPTDRNRRIRSGGHATGA